MPCYDLHVYLGDKLSSRLNGTALALPSDDVAHAAFRAGLVGPDPFFFDLIPPPLFRTAEKRTGNALHDRGADEVYATLFRTARAHAARDPQNAAALIAFSLGFLCHYTLDAAMHPLVCALYDGLDHTRFETALGCVLLNRFDVPVPLGKENRLLPARPLTKHNGAAQPPLDAIDALLADTVFQLFGYDIRGAYRRSYFKNLLFHVSMYDPRGRAHAFWHGFERVFRLKEGTVSGFLFCPLPPADRFDRLFAAATRETDTAASLFLGAVDRAAELFCHAVPALTTRDEQSAAHELDTLTLLLKGSTMSHGFDQ